MEGEHSEICKFFSNQVVFITGATGFIGCLLLEKLLRVCPDVKLIYLLIRQKKGKSQDDRLNSLFESVVFDNIKAMHSNLKNKVKLIPGDCSLPNLGLNEEDTTLLIKNVTCVLHSAANVRFNQSLKTATHINVKAIKELLRLAKSMENLKVMVHISTAFAHCPGARIDEEFYEMPVSANDMIKLVDSSFGDILDKITPGIINEWPNTYAFTKALAEELIKKEAGDLPIAIVRPAIVTSVHDEPTPGWTNSMVGPVSVFLLNYVGAIRVYPVNKKYIADFVPADYVVNNILAVAWDTYRQRQIAKGREETNKEKIPIYNYVSSVQNPLKWSQIFDILKTVGFKYYSVRSIWYPYLVCTKSLMAYKIYLFMLHMLPEYLVDGILILIGKEPTVAKSSKQIRTFIDVVSYYTLRKWQMSDNNVQQLWSRMNETDQKLFNFDIRKLDWAEYVEIFMKGGRIYILKDPLSTLPAGQRRKKILFVLHYSFVVFLFYMAFKLIYCIFNFVFSH